MYIKNAMERNVLKLIYLRLSSIRTKIKSNEIRWDERKILSATAVFTETAVDFLDELVHFHNKLL